MDTAVSNSRDTSRNILDTYGRHDQTTIRRARGETFEDSTFVRTDSIRSSSILKLAHVVCKEIVLHPFIALRRTCQVNRKCSPYVCFKPISLSVFMYQQQRKQGIAALYRGLTSELLVKGLTISIENAVANHSEWPQEIKRKSFFPDTLKVLVLRGVSVAIASPFLCSSVIETVQSVIVVKDRPSFIDCLKDGLLRLTHRELTPSVRMLPIWFLVMPTVFYHVSHKAVWHIAKATIEFIKNNLMFSEVQSPRKNHIDTKNIKTRALRTIPKTSTPNNLPRLAWPQDVTLARDLLDTTSSPNEHSAIDNDNEEISNCILASLVADIALLPVETVLNTLYIQGTKTMIDNCDGPTSVLEVSTLYDGFNDCYQSILRFEGNLGLFKGLGAIVLQYSVHFIIIRSLYFLIRDIQSSTTTKDTSSPYQSRLLPEEPSDQNSFRPEC